MWCPILAVDEDFVLRGVGGVADAFEEGGVGALTEVLVLIRVMSLRRLGTGIDRGFQSYCNFSSLTAVKIF